MLIISSPTYVLRNGRGKYNKDMSEAIKELREGSEILTLDFESIMLTQRSRFSLLNVGANKAKTSKQSKGNSRRYFFNTTSALSAYLIYYSIVELSDDSTSSEYESQPESQTSFKEKNEEKRGKRTG